MFKIKTNEDKIGEKKKKTFFERIFILNEWNVLDM